MEAFAETVQFIWEVADLLRGDFKAPEYEHYVLPFTVLRRFDCVLEATKAAVLRADSALADRTHADRPPAERHAALLALAQAPFYNVSPLDLPTLAATITHATNPDPQLARQLIDYINAFSPEAREVLQHFHIDRRITALAQKRLLAPVIQRFAAFGLYPPGRTPPGRRGVGNHEMGYIFEELIRKFKEQSQESAGEHFTPREIVRLMVDLLFHEDTDRLAQKDTRYTLYDPACGTGGMLSAAEEYFEERNHAAELAVFGQELNDESYAICLADVMLKGQDAGDRIKPGNSFTADGFPDARFDYCISNPPYGVSWKKVREAIETEATRGFAGRFGAGLPRVSDGSLLFLQHMIAKMKPPAEGGSRIAVVFAGSPMFTGKPGSGESEIRRWIIDNDWLEAIIALPAELFYNTGIRTYIWLVTNRKRPRRRGKVQLIDATAYTRRMPKSLGDKRNTMTPEDIATVVRLYGAFAPGENVRIFDNAAFGFRRITIDRPLRLRYRDIPARLPRLDAHAIWARYGEGTRRPDPAAQVTKTTIRGVLAALDPAADWDDRARFFADLRRRCRDAGVAIPTVLWRALGEALGERDPTAAPCLTRQGQPEPDPLLRDTDDVPLDEPIGSFLAREVLPHAPDAWIEPEKARLACRILFERVFHTWQPPRPVAELEADLRRLEAEAADLLRIILR